jgi:ATP-dependent Clp protease ATP-binding subunit ClpB
MVTGLRIAPPRWGTRALSTEQLVARAQRVRLVLTDCDGVLTDGQGKTVDFTNTIIILTSNLGSQYIAALRDDQPVADAEAQVMEIVRGHFRPEFLNRLDEIVLFQRLGVSAMAPIVDLQVLRVQALLKDRKVTLTLTDAARRWLARVGYDPVYGARPLKRTVQKHLQDPLAELILSGVVADGATVNVDEGDGKLVLTPA